MTTPLRQTENFRIDKQVEDFALAAMDGASLVLEPGFNAAFGPAGLLRPVADADLLGTTVARAGSAWNDNWNRVNGGVVGQLVEYGPNRVRAGDFGIVRETSAATNLVQNPRAEGAQVGTLTGGSPTGLLPSRWQLDAQGATVEFIGYEVSQGRTEALFRFTGTPTGDPIIWFEPSATAAAASNGSERTGISTVRLAAGSLTGIAGVAGRIQELTSAGASVAANSGTFFAPTADQRCALHSRTFSGGGTVARGRHGLIIDHTSGAIDVTLAISVPDFKSGLTPSTPVFPPALNLGESTRAAETFTFGVQTVRASRATYLDSNGVLRHFLPNTLRDGIDGKLIENEATNLWTWNRAFDNAAWTKVRTTVAANVARAPDGQQTADRIVPNAETNSFYVTRSVTVAAGATVAVSFIVRADGYNVPWIQLDDGSFDNWRRAHFLLAGAGTSADDTGAGGMTQWRRFMRRLGDGYYLIGVAGRPSASYTTARVRLGVSNALGVTTFTANGTSGIIVAGSQLEVGDSPSSMIDTTTATATRQIDTCTLSLAGLISGSQSARVGTFVAEFIMPLRSLGPAASASRPVIAFRSGSSSRGTSLVAQPDNNQVRAFRRNSDGFTQSIITGPTPGDRVIAVFAWDEAGQTLAVNGDHISTTDVRIAPDHQTLGIGAYAMTGSQTDDQRLNGNLLFAAYHPRRLTVAEAIERSLG